MPFNITIDHETTRHSSDRSSSAEDDDSSDTGVHLSPHSGTYESFEPNEEHEGSWRNVIHPDEIRPSDSASRPRTANRQRPLVEAPQPEDARRPAYRRRITQERRRNAPQPRSHHPPPSSESDTVDPHEEWQGDAYGPPYGRAYAPYTAAFSPQHFAMFPPSHSITPLSHSGQIPHQQIVPYGFPGYQQVGPALPGPTSMGHTHPLMASGAGAYNPPGGYYPYTPHGYPMPQINQQPHYVPYPVYTSPPPAAASTASPPQPLTSTTKEDERFSRLETLLMDQKKEQAAKEAAAEKVAADKLAKAEANAERAKEIKAATDKAAKEAKEEADKEHQAAVRKAAIEADRAVKDAKAATEAAAKAQGPPAEKKRPIKFKDAVGRKFQFPFHLCATWSGMEYLIKEAFTHVEVIGPHVEQGHYDLLGPQGEIILPHVWETVIEPDWTITMHMWPMNEEKETAAIAGAEAVAEIVAGAEGGPPPPPPAPSAPYAVGEDGKKGKKKKTQAPGLLGWTSSRRSSAKGKKK